MQYVREAGLSKKNLWANCLKTIPFIFGNSFYGQICLWFGFSQLKYPSEILDFSSVKF